jgi:hypothetical protein
MIFETKFNIGDRAWFMRDNLPVEAIISAITIFHVGTNQDATQYNAKKVAGSVSWLDYQHLNERSLFKTKRDLLASLFESKTICKGAKCSAIDGVGHSDGCIKEHDQVCLDSATEIIPGTLGVLNRLKISTPASED